MGNCLGWLRLTPGDQVCAGDGYAEGELEAPQGFFSVCGCEEHGLGISQSWVQEELGNLAWVFSFSTLSPLVCRMA